MYRLLSGRQVGVVTRSNVIIDGGVSMCVVVVVARSPSVRPKYVADYVFSDLCPDRRSCIPICRVCRGGGGRWRRVRVCRRGRGGEVVVSSVEVRRRLRLL